MRLVQSGTCSTACRHRAAQADLTAFTCAYLTCVVKRGPARECSAPAPSLVTYLAASCPPQAGDRRLRPIPLATPVDARLKNSFLQLLMIY